MRKKGRKLETYALKVLVLNASLDDIERLGHSDRGDLRHSRG